MAFVEFDTGASRIPDALEYDIRCVLPFRVHFIEKLTIGRRHLHLRNCVCSQQGVPRYCQRVRTNARQPRKDGWPSSEAHSTCVLTFAHHHSSVHQFALLHDHATSLFERAGCVHCSDWDDSLLDLCRSTTSATSLGGGLVQRCNLDGKLVGR